MAETTHGAVTRQLDETARTNRPAACVSKASRAARPMGPMRVTFTNLLRAELYRLVRLPAFWLGLVAMAGVALTAYTLNLLVILADGTMATAQAWIEPSNAGPFGFCPLVVGMVMVALVGADERAGAIRSLAGSGLRRAYVSTTGAVLLLTTIAHIVVVESVLVAFPPIANLPVRPVDPAVFMLGFAGMVLLVMALAALPLALAIATGMERVGMFLAVVWGLMSPDAWLDGALASVGEAAPALADACELMRAGLLTSVAEALMSPANVLGNPADVARILLVPLGWLAAAGLFAHLSLRRRAL